MTGSTDPPARGRAGAAPTPSSPGLPPEAASALASAVGAEAFEPAPAVSVGGVRPAAAVRPTDVSQLSAVLRVAAEHGLAVSPSGGGTKLDWGSPPSACGLLVSTAALDEVVEYDPLNLTVTAGAGARPADLADLAAADGLVFPLDPPDPGAATLGGVLAVNDHGPRRLLRGGVRDVVLGMRAVLAGGDRIKAGGRTIKNVTGYDVTRLFVGSMGALGVLSEVTLRLLPRPACERVLLVPTSGPAAAAALVATLLRSHLTPSALTLLSPAAARTLLPHALVPGPVESDGRGDVLLVVGAEGHAAAVERHVREVLETAGRPAAAQVTPDGEAAPVWSALASARAGAREAGLPVEVKAAVPLSAVGALLSAVDEARVHGAGGPFWWADAGSGVVTVRLSDQGEDLASLRGLRALSVDLGGSLIVTDGAASLAGSFAAWGGPPAALGVMKALKSRFDPQGLMNPGRSPGGL